MVIITERTTSLTRMGITFRRQIEIKTKGD